MPPVQQADINQRRTKIFLLWYRNSLKEYDAAKCIEDAVAKVLKEGYLTGDLMESGASPRPALSTSEMGDKIASEING